MIIIYMYTCPQRRLKLFQAYVMYEKMLTKMPTNNTSYYNTIYNNTVCVVCVLRLIDYTGA